MDAEFIISARRLKTKSLRTRDFNWLSGVIASRKILKRFKNISNSSPKLVNMKDLNQSSFDGSRFIIC